MAAITQADVDQELDQLVADGELWVQWEPLDSLIDECYLLFELSFTDEEYIAAKPLFDDWRKRNGCDQPVCDDQRHLVCRPYSIEGLHRMARALRIKRCWFHRNHYDIPKKRVAEVMSMCEVVSPREVLKLIKGHE